jgi:hypothetical protein
LCLSIGVPDELFWRLTLREIEAVIDRHIEAERQRTLRAAFVAAAIYNVNRKKGAKIIQATDLIREPPKPEDYMTVEESRAMLNAWAKSINADYEQGLMRVKDSDE